MKKTSITLRQRTLPSGKVTLYLDIVSGGRRKSESLGLFLVPELSRLDKQKNKETLKLAEAVRAKRFVEAQSDSYDINISNDGDVLFHDYFEAVIASMNQSGQSQKDWISCLKRIEAYDPNVKSLALSNITKDWVKGFRTYLERSARSRDVGKRQRKQSPPLAVNSQVIYFKRLKACLNRAVKDGLLKVSPAAGIEGIKKEETTRMYLTTDEVRLLARTPCKSDGVKRAFLFSCLTGLRRSDIERLTWGEVKEQDSFTRIIFKQKKTGGMEYLDIAPQAAELMGETGNTGQLVFPGILTPSYTNKIIADWVQLAGIGKKITFHCARHTFAVMMLDLGTDIYTVSKLLGHREVQTTQIYAKVLDKNKQAAVAKIPDILND